MKKYKKIVYLLLIVVIAVSSVILYANESKGNEKNEKEKSFSEVEFLETKLETLLNEMNNIETKNYKVSVSDSTSDGNEQSGKKFDLKTSGVLVNPNDINWNKIKSEIETLYSSLPTITLDLYQLSLNQNDILGFNKEFDNLTVAAKAENKEETLKELSKLYEYVPKFMQNATDEETKKIVATTKSNIFKAYSKLDSKNWDEISKDTKQAVDTYSKLLTNTNIDSSKQYNISKGYVMINELQNAVEVKDEAVFLIKYKNILEEMNNL